MTETAQTGSSQPCLVEGYSESHQTQAGADERQHIGTQEQSHTKVSQAVQQAAKMVCAGSALRLSTPDQSKFREQSELRN